MSLSLSNNRRKRNAPSFLPIVHQGTEYTHTNKRREIFTRRVSIATSKEEEKRFKSQTYGTKHLSSLICTGHRRMRAWCILPPYRAPWCTPLSVFLSCFLSVLVVILPLSFTTIPPTFYTARKKKCSYHFLFASSSMSSSLSIVTPVGSVASGEIVYLLSLFCSHLKTHDWTLCTQVGELSSLLLPFFWSCFSWRASASMMDETRERESAPVEMCHTLRSSVVYVCVVQYQKKKRKTRSLGGVQESQSVRSSLSSSSSPW